MGRTPRVDIGNEIYHVLNRSNARTKIFHKEGDYYSFINILTEAKNKFDIRILAFCIMPNHWHLVLHPKNNGDLARFVGWVTLTHTQRYHSHQDTIGLGHIYQGRYKSFIVQNESYLFRLCRYVERNALRAGLVDNAHKWKWGSAWIRLHGSKKQKELLSPWTDEMPDDYEYLLNTTDDSDEAKSDIEEIRMSTKRDRPYGDERWIKNTTERFGTQSVLRARGRPKSK